MNYAPIRYNFIMATDTQNGHSLWFVPNQEARSTLDSIIRELARRLQAPVFVPHITLIPDVIGTTTEVISHTQAIASSFTRFPITMEKIDFITDSLYQCLYVYCQPTPHLSQIVTTARHEFSRQDDPPHKPHISILYKQDTPDEIKKKLVEEFTPRIADLSFTASSIEIWTNGFPIENWTKVGEFPLSPKEKSP